MRNRTRPVIGSGGRAALAPCKQQRQPGGWRCSSTSARL